MGCGAVCLCACVCISCDNSAALPALLHLVLSVYYPKLSYQLFVPSCSQRLLSLCLCLSLVSLSHLLSLSLTLQHLSASLLCLSPEQKLLRAKNMTVNPPQYNELEPVKPNLLKSGKKIYYQYLQAPTIVSFRERGRNSGRQREGRKRESG